MIRYAAPLLLAFTIACTGSLEIGLPPDLDDGAEPDPDPGTSNPDPDPNPDPGTEPTPLAITEVQVGFDAAVLAALSGAAGATVTDTRAEALISGTVTAGDATVTFQNLRLIKAPFAIAGSATVEARGQSASVVFAGDSASGKVSVGGAPLGSFIAAFPALDDLAEDAVIELLGLVLECQGIDVAEINGVLSFNGTCTLRDEAGTVLGTASLAGVEIDLVNGDATGTITVDAAGTVAEIRLLGASADLIVNGSAVGSVDLSALVAALF